MLYQVKYLSIVVYKANNLRLSHFFHENWGCIYFHDNFGYHTAVKYPQLLLPHRPTFLGNSRTSITSPAVRDGDLQRKEAKKTGDIEMFHGNNMIEREHI